MPNGFALTQAASTEVVVAYGTGPSSVPAVDATPGWEVVGAFYLPKSCDARLDMLALVSSDVLTLRARLFDMTTGAPVSGSTAQTAEVALTRALSGVVSLTGGRIYQIQAECTGDSGLGLFGVVETATISD